MSIFSTDREGHTMVREDRPVGDPWLLEMENPGSIGEWV